MAKEYAAPALPELKVTEVENSRQLGRRFTYLWQTAHALLPTNATLANHLLASMMQQARANRVELPRAVLDFICERCGGLLLPSISADVRVVPQSCKSRVNRRLARQQRLSQPQTSTHGGPSPRVVRESLTNVVRVTCHRCQHASLRPGASVVHKSKLKKRVRDATQDTSEQTAKRAKTEASVDSSNKPLHAVAVQEAVPAVPPPSSMFAPPPSPPRKLLDGPKKRKKKKKKAPDAAVTAVKSSLSSFLQSLKPSSARK